jgi:LCP family protein required for cell wall assembly
MMSSEGADGHQPSRRAGGTRSHRLGRALRAIAQVTAAVLSLTVFVASGYAWASFRHLSQTITHVSAIAPVDPAHPVKDIDGGDQNILLVGDDHRPANATPAELALLSTQQDGGGDNTDTMMVLHVPANGASATLISFPRDSWVNIPGFGMNKLNAAFEFGSENGGGDAGGARLLISVIQTMTGLTIDHFVRISLLGFYQIAQVLGRVQVCLNEAAVDSYSGTNLPPGKSTLDAQQALSFVRQRHNLPNGDLDREVRQQYFLSAELRKVVSAGTLLDPLKVQRLLTAVGSAVETDPGLNLLSFAQQLRHLQAGNLKVATIPITGTPTITVGGTQVSIVAVNFAALPGFIDQVIGKPTASQQAVAASPATVSVQVLNGTTGDGVATAASATLSRAGFRTQAPGSAAPVSTTTIEYPAGAESQAKAVAAYLPGAAVAQVSTVKVVTVLLGDDGLRPVAPHPASATTAAPAPAASASASASSPARSFAANSCIN